MKTKFFSSIRWKFIFLVIASSIFTFIIMAILVWMSYLISTIDPLSDIARFFSENEGILVLMLMFASLIIFLLSYFLLSQRSISYLEEIVRAVQQIERGNLDTRIPRRTKDELGELAESISKMSSRLKSSIDEERRAERTKNELVTSISHDLRTPLTSILGYLELINNDRYKEELEMRYYVDIAYSKSLRLKKLIEDLFDFTRISYEGIKLNVSRVNLLELLEQLAEEFVPIFDEVGMQYRLNIPNEKVYVEADGDMIVRVFENLITNAIRYGKEGKYVDTELSKDKGSAVVKIINYGDAIPEKDIPFIFDRLYRVEKSRSEKTGGTGLGLAIAKSIVELHKGNISAYNRNGCVIFEIRLNAAA